MSWSGSDQSQPLAALTNVDAQAGLSTPSEEAPEHLPISYLNALMYCPRRFFYEYAQGEMLVNEHVLQGRVHHKAADTHGTRIVDGVVTMRRVYVYSNRLRIAGLIDVVEAPLAASSPEITAPTGPLVGPGEEPISDDSTTRSLYPVEYKKGSARGGGANDHVQLCAQGMCLEERLGRTLAGGYVFSFSSMRRTWIPFTADLRAQTERAILQAFALLRAGVLPAPLPLEQAGRCRACSLEPLCLPDEVRALSVSASTSDRARPEHPEQFDH